MKRRACVRGRGRGGRFFGRDLWGDRFTFLAFLGHSPCGRLYRPEGYPFGDLETVFGEVRIMGEQERSLESPNPDEGTSDHHEERPPIGPVGRITGILFSPTETFADIARHPTWAFILIVTILLSSASIFLLQFRVPNMEKRYEDILRQKIEEALEKQGAAKPPREALDRQIEMQKRIFRFLPLFPVAVIPLTALVLAGVFFVGLLVLQADTTFKKTFSVVSWSYGVTTSVGALLGLLVLFLRDPALIDPTNPEGWVATNLGAMLGLSPEKTHPALFALSTSLDIFTIWFLILAAIGFSAISRKLPRTKSAILVFALWGVWVVGKVVWYTFTGRT